MWLLVLHYVFSTPSPHPTLLATEIWHFRREPDDEPGARPELPREEQNGQKEPVPALSMVDLEARLAEVERELEEKRRACEEVTSELAARKEEQEDVEDEIIELSLASFGIKDGPQPVDPADLPPFLGDTWQRYYRSLLDLVGQVQSLEGEPEELQSEIDDLECELEEIEERLDQGYTSWTEREYRKAEVVLERPTPVPASPARPLLGTEALGRLSEEARKIFETYTRLEQVYSTDQGLRNLDCGPLIATMSKVCERILSDFLDPRCRTLLSDPALEALLADPSYVLSIPPEDQHFKIDKGSVRKVLNFLDKPSPVHWSGPRNGAIALLLFGTDRAGDDTAAPLDNPLRLYGDDEDRKALRVELYRLQQIRNGFVHHESAEWNQVQEAKGCFETCLWGLVSVLYGLPPDTSNTG